MTRMILIAHLAREVYEYQNRHGGKSPELMLVSPSIMEILEKEAEDSDLYKAPERPSNIQKICGVKVLVDTSRRIAQMMP